MRLDDLEERWSRMLVQAARLADLDAALDAVTRARACLAEIDAELAQAKHTPALDRLSQARERAGIGAAAIEASYAAWQERVEARRDLYQAHEADAYAKPLPSRGVS